MKTIRKRSFETNSSSVHSLTIDLSFSGRDYPEGKFVTLGEFGWDWDTYNSFEEKASYFWTFACCAQSYHESYFERYPKNKWMLELKERMVKLSKEHKFYLREPETGNDFFYVDHGSEHMEQFAEDYDIQDDKVFMDLLTRKHYIIKTGNDNDDCYYDDWD